MEHIRHHIFSTKPINSAYNIRFARMDYALDLLIKGLSTICAPYSEQQKNIYDDGSPIDEVFDFIVLDGLDYLVNSQQITLPISEAVSGLYLNADETLKTMDSEQEDLLFNSDSEVVNEWKRKAEELLQEILEFQKTKRAKGSK